MTPPAEPAECATIPVAVTPATIIWPVDEICARRRGPTARASLGTMDGLLGGAKAWLRPQQQLIPFQLTSLNEVSRKTGGTHLAQAEPVRLTPAA